MINLNSKLFSKIFTCICLLIFIYILYLQSYIPALTTPTFHIDGAFQTSSALFHLLSGNNIGEDFFFYLGVGPAYLLYPFFKLAGGTLSSSVLVSYLITKVILFLSISILTKLSLNLSLTKTILLALFFYVVFSFISPELYNESSEPGHSLRAVRRFVPIIGAFALLFLPIISKGRRAFFLAVIAGLLATWSNDYGYFAATFLSLYFIYEYFIDSKSLKSLIINGIIFATTSIVAYFLIIAVVTNGHTLEWITYNFKGVGESQWWYFISYTDKVFYIDEIHKIFFREGAERLSVFIVVSFFLIPSLFVLSILKKNIHFLILAYVGLVIFSGSFISEYLGHLNAGYWSGINLWLFFSILSLIHTFIIKGRYSNAGGILFSFLSFLLVVYLCFDLVKWREYASDESKKLNPDMYNETFNSYLDPDFSEYSEYVKFFEKVSLDKNVTIFEEYSSLASIILNRNSVVPFDSIIHSLGKDNQELLLRKLIENQPTYITTTNKYFSHWQAWSVSQNWWFYSYVLQNYRIEKIFPNHYVWKKNEIVRPFKKNQDLKCKGDKSNIVVKSSKAKQIPKLIQIKISYELTNTSKVIALIKNHISHYPLSIDTTRYQNNASFPYVMFAEDSIIKTQVLPENKKESFNIKSCEVLEVHCNDCKYLFHAFKQKDKPFNLTDQHWLKGVGRTISGFFVYYLGANEKFKVGNKIKFKNDEIRTITKIKQNSYYLNIYFDGNPLDGNIVGYPNDIEIINEKK